MLRPSLPANTPAMLRLFCLLLCCALPARAAVTQSPPDPFVWLEDVNGARAMDWVRAHNAPTLARLQADPRYAGFHDTALALAQAQDRIPTPRVLGGQVYNLWQDDAHPQGIWRRTSPADYATATPHWTTVLDLDALGRADGKRWVWKGAACWSPQDRRCLISLSDGGEDAVRLREFDLPTAAFVPGGFDVPRSKLAADWLDADTILIATDWGADKGGGGSMTASGYPYVVKRLRRGQALAEASEVYRGTPADVSVTPMALADGQGHHAMLLQRGVDFFRSDLFVVDGAAVRKLALPQKIQPVGLLDGRLIVLLAEPFGALPAGSLAAIDLAHADATPELVFAPGPRQSVETAATTRTKIVAAVYDNVRGRAMVFTRAGGTGAGGTWNARRLDLPDNAAVDVVDATVHDDRVFVSVTGFLQPTALYAADLATAPPPAVVKALPGKFDTADLVTEQHEGTSSDGTRIPYFIVHRRDMPHDGRQPTLLYAYGGFQVSMTPSYNAALGRLWLDRGGVYVLANIRGGGEFGPAWHEAGLKTKRQIVYDDFVSVAQDLFARKITDPAHLGIRGGSNGGLLMGVQFTQHPELWRAVIIDVPLLDMLRFEQIAAGASWVGEYGSVANPDERAFLARISPYNNLHATTTYPLPFIFTTTKDDRVGPVHARKFAARLEALGKPFLYYEATEGGHGAGANQRQVAQEQALEMTYLSERLKGPAQ